MKNSDIYESNKNSNEMKKSKSNYISKTSSGDIKLYSYENNLWVTFLNRIILNLFIKISKVKESSLKIIFGF